MTSGHRTVYLLLTGLLILAFSLLYWPVIFDDAFITYRYGKNLANGGGVDFHSGEKPYNGFTSFGHVLMSAAVHLAGLPPHFTMKLLGVITLCATLFILFKTLALLGVEEKVRYLSLLIYLTNPSVVYHSLNGMETIYYTFALHLMILTSLAWSESKSGNTLLLVAALLIPGILRPEGFLAAGLCFVYVLWTSGRQLLHKRNVFVLLAGAAVLAAFFLWKHYYFGTLLTGSYHHKKHITPAILPFLSKRALRDCITYLVRSLPFFLTATILMTTTCLKATTCQAALAVRKRSGSFVIFVFVLGCVLTSVYLRFETVTNAFSRFFIPYFGFFVIVLARGLALAEAKITGWKSRRFAVRSVIFLVIVIIAWHGAWVPAAFESAMNKGIHKRMPYLVIGNALRSQHRDRYTLAVTSAGIIPYLAEWKTIDMLGLNTRKVARHVTKMDDINRDIAGIVLRESDVIITLSRTVYDLSSETGRTNLFFYDSGRKEVLKKKAYKSDRFQQLYRHERFDEFVRAGILQRGGSVFSVYVRQSLQELTKNLKDDFLRFSMNYLLNLETYSYREKMLFFIKTDLEMK